MARVLPAALGDWEPFGLGRDLAAITHTHPGSWLAAGAAVHMVQTVVLGGQLSDAAESVWSELETEPEGASLLEALDAALDAGDLGDPTPARAARFGTGETATSALAIGVYCASATDELEEGVNVAAGFGPSAACVAGALLGARGTPPVPQALREPLELESVVVQVARDLWAHFAAGRFEPDEDDWNRYPG
jgi:ADP-ribosylglycohydrolase